MVDTVYNTDGLTASTTAPYYNSGAPSGTLVQAQAGRCPPRPAIPTTAPGGRSRPRPTAMARHLGHPDGLQRQRHHHHHPARRRHRAERGHQCRGQTTDLYQYHAGVTPDPVNDPASDYSDTHYTYTPAGQQASETDAAGDSWSWGYNLLGQQTSADDPDTGASSSSYDNAGQLLSTTDARGKQTSYTYDLDGRKTAAYDTTGGAAESTADQIGAWTYDTLKKGFPTATTSYQLGTASPSETSAVLAYNSFGDAAAVKTTLANLPADEAALAPSVGYTNSYAYNTVGALLDQQDAASGGLPAETINYGYDTYGQPTSLGSNGNSYVTSVGYDDYGNPLLYSMGTSTDWVDLALTYDPRPRPSPAPRPRTPAAAAWLTTPPTPGRTARYPRARGC
ncbi:RHS repeat protein [Streptacidiphilus sp. 4-A2]|nr:RHS repeat protein [Streptacidiphilus sp. 4-A2]